LKLEFSGGIGRGFIRFFAVLAQDSKFLIAQHAADCAFGRLMAVKLQVRVADMGQASIDRSAAPAAGIGAAALGVRRPELQFGNHLGLMTLPAGLAVIVKHLPSAQDVDLGPLFAIDFLDGLLLNATVQAGVMLPNRQVAHPAEHDGIAHGTVLSIDPVPISINGQGLTG
jgi:hypothetical protein